MSLFSDAEIADLRGFAAETFSDSGHFQTVTITTDSYGGIVEAHVDGPAIACKFLPLLALGSAQTEVTTADGTVIRVSAQVRMAVSEYENAKAADRFKVTHRDGAVLATPEVFEIVGRPQLGTAFVQVNLRQVEK